MPDDTSKYLLSGLIAVASFLAARVFERFDRGQGDANRAQQALQVEVAALRERVRALERALAKEHEHDCD